MVVDPGSTRNKIIYKRCKLMPKTSLTLLLIKFGKGSISPANFQLIESDMNNLSNYFFTKATIGDNQEINSIAS